jgi:hypothetical protein
MTGSSDGGRDPYAPQAGDRLLLPCAGGPSTSRLVTFPPPLELEDDGGTYVLVDDGARPSWHYVWLPRA